jgi:hypothetical protein
VFDDIPQNFRGTRRVMGFLASFHPSQDEGSVFSGQSDGLEVTPPIRGDISIQQQARPSSDDGQHLPQVMGQSRRSLFLLGIGQARPGI